MIILSTQVAPVVVEGIPGHQALTARGHRGRVHRQHRPVTRRTPRTIGHHTPVGAPIGELNIIKRERRRNSPSNILVILLPLEGEGGCAYGRDRKICSSSNEYTCRIRMSGDRWRNRRWRRRRDGGGKESGFLTRYAACIVRNNRAVRAIVVS